MGKGTVQNYYSYHKRRRNADMAAPVFYRCRLLLFSVLALCLATVFIVFPTSSNLDLLDDGSVFAPITARKVASKWKGYLSSAVKSAPTGKPKLYFPRHCPSSNRSCAIMVPSFIIAGGEASGTTYIFDTLSKHPQVVGTVDHERTQVLFDLDMRDDTALYETYLSEFPLVHDALRSSMDKSEEVVVGEHAPQYLYKSHVAARRLRELLPHVKLVFVLRDPIDRAYLHYVNDQADQVSSFENLIDKELDILRQCVRTTIGWDEFVRCHQSSEIQASRELDITISTLDDTHETTDDSKNRTSPTYDLLARGMYYTALLPFLEQFPASQILVFRTEDFLNNPSFSFQKLAKFLGIDPTFFSERNFYRNQADSSSDLLHTHISTTGRRHGSLRHGRISALAMEDELDESSPEPLWSDPPETALTDLEMRYRLQKVFRNLNARLLELFNDDFPGWTYDVDKG